jgi:DNA repair protein RecO (recombination protein O)
MPYLESEAIILRQYSLSDADRIVVFVTREHGKIRAVAKGIKKTRSPLAACLEPLNYIQLAFFAKEGRDLHQIRHAELIHSYLGKSKSLNLIYSYSYFAELINELVQDNQANEALFRLLLACLRAGESETGIKPLLRYFEVWCLKLSGLLPNYAYCSNCGKCVKDDGFFAWIEAGQVRCVVCAQGRGLRVGMSAAAALRSMQTMPPERFGAEPLGDDAIVDLERLSQKLLGLHLEKPLKSYRILKEALQSQ